MARKTLVALATAWGPKHGGINSFNYDFVKALGVAFHDAVAVYCVVPNATDDEIQDARNAFVTLVRLLQGLSVGRAARPREIPEAARDLHACQLAIWGWSAASR